MTFLSDTFEGSITSKDICLKSGLLDLLLPTWSLQRIFNKRRTDGARGSTKYSTISAWQGQATNSSKALTKCIARARIHVERATERMEKNKILSSNFPLSLKAVASQIVHVV